MFIMGDGNNGLRMLPILPLEPLCCCRAEDVKRGRREGEEDKSSEREGEERGREGKLDKNKQESPVGKSLVCSATEGLP